MELQEAIEHAREVAEGCAAGNKNCAYQHDKLADWLEELKSVKDILGDEYDLDHLRDLLEADRGGRCVVFKFGIGSTVYRVWENPYTGSAYITEHGMYDLKNVVEAESWWNAYPTREAAEAALKGEQDG